MSIAHERLVTYEQARGLFPQNPSIRTIKSWVSDGIRGIRLESTPSGGIRVTSVEAVARFLAAQAQQAKEARS